MNMNGDVGVDIDVNEDEDTDVDKDRDVGMDKDVNEDEDADVDMDGDVGVDKDTNEDEDADGNMAGRWVWLQCDKAMGIDMGRNENEPMEISYLYSNLSSKPTLLLPPQVFLPQLCSLLILSSFPNSLLEVQLVHLCLKCLDK